MTECPNCLTYHNKNEYVDECTRCGIGRTICVQKKAEEQDYTKKTYEQNRARLKYHKRLYSRCLRKYLLKKYSLLDIGCADGIFIKFLLDHGVAAEGIDSYPDQEIYPDTLNIQNVKFEQFTEASKYDFITMIHVFEHIKEPIEALKKCRRLLKDGGKIFIAVPNYGGWWAKYTGIDWPWLNPAEHRYHYTAKSLRLIFERQGFRILWIKTDSYVNPSILNIVLSKRKIFETGFFSIWPLRPILFRLSDFFGKYYNFFADLRGEGGELQLLAEIYPRA